MIKYIIKATPSNVEKILGIISTIVRDGDGGGLEEFIGAIVTLHNFGLVQDEICQLIELFCDELLKILDGQEGVLH